MSGRKTDDRAALNRRWLHGWNFRVYALNQFWGNQFRKIAGDNQTFSSKVFFMDLDGVFDSEVLGFPHTTPSAISALSILRDVGYTVVPNTGRSVEHVRNYCGSYGFAAGIGEYGSVLFDNVNDREIPLVDEGTLEQLELCREALGTIEGVSLDPSYRYSVRAYRHTSRGTEGLNPEEATSVVKRARLSGLRVISKNADTYFVGGEANKGNAIRRYLDYSATPVDETVAIGDSAEDIPMFGNVVRSYAPANCADEVRRVSGQYDLDVVGEARQRGLLRAAEKEAFGRLTKGKELPICGENPFTTLMCQLLRISEAGRLQRLLLLLDRRNLGFGFGGE